jgi:hypothetical protein
MEETKGMWGGGLVAWWALVVIIGIAIFVWIWNRNCTEKTEIAVGLANIAGRVNALEPAVASQGNNIYKLNGVVSATVQGVGDLKECTNDKLDFLEGQVLFKGNRRCGGCGGSEYKRTQTYNLASTALTVDDTCRN